IYGPDTRVKFFNSAFARLWRLDSRWLGTEPTMAEVLEILRENRRLPETGDFPTYKKEQNRRLMSVIEPYEEVLHLPDGLTVRMLAVPHPFGGILSTYEDVTDRLALERSYNTLIAVQRETLDNLYEGVAVFGGDGRLKLWNPAYARVWNLSPTVLAGDPHVSTIVDLVRSLFAPSHDWAKLRARLITRVAEPEEKTGRLHGHHRTL